MIKGILFIALCSFSCLNIYSQVSSNIESIASLLIENGNESRTEDLIDYLYELSQYPLELNFSSENELNHSGLFSPFQVYGILKYREKYGTLFSIYELAVIPGFRKEYLEQIAPLLFCASEKTISGNKYRQGMILSNMSFKYPVGTSYIKSDSTPSFYPGSPLKKTDRIKYNFNDHWFFGAIYEKDAGEEWLNKKLPEHLAAYLMFSSDKLINQLIVGNYRIHRGMGLVHGLGFSSRSGPVGLNGFRRSYAKAFASSAEYDYFRGIYANFGKRTWKTDLFLSIKPEDFSFHDFDNKMDLFEQIRKTGIHRTSSEIEGINLANNYSSGISINKSFERWNIGMSGSHSILALSQLALDSINSSSPIRSQSSNLSIYGVGFGPAYEIFGELALDQKWRKALVFGGNYDFNPALSLSLSIRNYQVDFSSQTPLAPSAGNKPENEKGMNIGFSIAPFSHALIQLNSDFSGKPDTRSIDPDNGFDVYNTLQCNYKYKETTEMEFRITSRLQQQMEANNLPGNGQYQYKKLSRYRLDAKHSVNGNLSLQSRLEFSHAISEFKNSPGMICYQQIELRPTEKLRFVYRFLLFNVEEWDMRIYTYEPGVKYSFLFPAWYGKGKRNILTISWKYQQRLTLRGKIGYTEYANKYETGSGYDIRPGNSTWDIEVQLQFDLQRKFKD